MEKKHAWYSKKAVAQGAGTSFYAREDGTEVEITVVTDTEDLGYPYFDDKEYLGLVVTWLRYGVRSKSKHLKG